MPTQAIEPKPLKRDMVISEHKNSIVSKLLIAVIHAEYLSEEEGMLVYERLMNGKRFADTRETHTCWANSLMFDRALEKMYDYLEMIKDLPEKHSRLKSENEALSAKLQGLCAFPKESIFLLKDLKLSYRAHRVIREVLNLHTMEDLKVWIEVNGWEKMAMARDIGKKTLQELKALLEKQ